MTSPSAQPLPTLELPIDSIIVGERIRKDFGDIDDLADSIAKVGLIQPIVVSHDHRLIAGERRLRAHRKLSMATIKAVYLEVLTEDQRVILEATENIVRKDMTWQERVLAIEKVHRFKSTEYALKGESWGIRETGRLLRQSKSPIGRAVFIAEYLHSNDKEIWFAESMEDAYRVLIKREEDAAAKLLVAQTIPSQTKTGKQDSSGVLSGSLKPTAKEVSDSSFFDGPQGNFTPFIGGPVTTNERPGGQKEVQVVPLSQIFLKSTGPCDTSVLANLGPDCCQHIICDPPYGVPDHMEMIDQENTGSDASSVVDEHIAEQTEMMMLDFRPLSYRAIRPGGFLLMFCDPIRWWDEACLFEKEGFTIQRWPLVWHKTSACSNGQASKNFTKNIEFVLAARKGPTATLVSHQKSSVWTGGSDAETRLLGHPFAKPSALWEWLFSATCLRGADVLDPFAGSCSSALPAIKLGLRWRGIECSEKHYGTGMTNLMNLYKSLDPTCTFV